MFSFSVPLVQFGPHSVQLYIVITFSYTDVNNILRKFDPNG